MDNGNRKVSILVLNYNGEKLLAKFLSSIVEAVEYSNRGHEIILVDNASTDGSIQFVRKNYPTVKVQTMRNNERLYSYNQVVKDCRNDYVSLMNNDVRVNKNYLDPLLGHFDDPAVFAVMPRINSDNQSERYISRCVGSFTHGILGSGRYKNIRGFGYSLYVHCASIYDRKKFFQLGGLDRIYWPEYTAEMDICYLAWMRGWKVLFEPKSAVFHVGDQTIGPSIGSSQKDRIRMRGALIFFLKCISDKKMFTSWAMWSLLRLGRYFVKKDKPMIGAYIDFVKLIPQIIGKRKNAQALRQLSDRDILQTLQRGIDDAI